MTHRTVFLTDDEAVRHLAPAKSAKTDRADRFALADVVRAGLAYRVVGAAGDHLAALVLQPFGAALWITAAAGRAGMPLCPLIDQFATEAARVGGYRAVAFRTERRGLVARARALGYEVERQNEHTYIMKKSIQ